MSEGLTDLFPGFAARQVPTRAGRIFCRVGGEGPPLLLLHGYPQTHVMWHRVAPALAAHFTVVVADLPGYGDSDVPETDAAHTPYTKRAMAQVLIDGMEQLGHPRFALAGHDRGGRVAYRMALDHPEWLTKVVVLDILPTYDYWSKMDRAFALRIYHWAFLAQPFPVPEQLICCAPDAYFERVLRSWVKPGTRPFDPRALAHYLAALRDPVRIRAACEDYRAGAHADFEQDRADFEAGRRISVPMLVLWGTSGIASAASTPLDTWRLRASDVTGVGLDAGHFLCEEDPVGTTRALLAFCRAGTA